jgi:rhodanese-related sulfurtransferase
LFQVKVQGLFCTILSCARPDTGLTESLKRRCGISETSVGGVHILSIAVEEAWAKLERDPRAVLVDVRTRAEWTFVGVADLRSIGKRPLFVEWQSFGAGPDPAFVEHVRDALASCGADYDSELLFLCRSGQRSLLAAQATAAAGYGRCRNISDGFEGPLDPAGHRGRLAGWKARELPWAQS